MALVLCDSPSSIHPSLHASIHSFRSLGSKSKPLGATQCSRGMFLHFNKDAGEWVRCRSIPSVIHGFTSKFSFPRILSVLPFPSCTQVMIELQGELITKGEDIAGMHLGSLELDDKVFAPSSSSFPLFPSILVPIIHPFTHPFAHPFIHRAVSISLSGVISCLERSSHSTLRS